MNDFYQIDPESMICYSLQERVNGPLPGTRYGLGMAYSSKRMWLFGGAGYDLGEFRFISLPKNIAWPRDGIAIGFIEAYDWDQVLVDENRTVFLQFHFDLCMGIFPCVLSIRGTINGGIERKGIGSISCRALSGCQGVTLEDLTFKCNNELLTFPLLEIQGSYLSVNGSTFYGCTSDNDGSIIQSYDRAVALINHSKFENLHSQGFGGAISAVGSAVQIFESQFIRCTAGNSGGAIWASTYECYGSAKSENTSVQVYSSIFLECSTNGSGGAIMADSSHTDYYSFGEIVDISIISSTFDKCTSGVEGGVLSASGLHVYVKVQNCSHSRSYSTGFGGAISTTASTVIISKSSFVNIRSENGGGCIWAAGYQGSAVVKATNSTLQIESSSFKFCVCTNTGGAIMVSQPLSNANNELRVNINSTIFVHCRSISNGGAFSASGLSVANISDSVFSFCSAANSGGAISAEDRASVILRKSVLEGNSANGLGGGALFISKSHFLLYGCSSSRNSALNGGGGVLLWDGKTLVTSDIVDLNCDDSNFDNNINIDLQYVQF